MIPLLLGSSFDIECVCVLTNSFALAVEPPAPRRCATGPSGGCRRETAVAGVRATCLLFGANIIKCAALHDRVIRIHYGTGMTWLADTLTRVTKGVKGAACNSIKKIHT